MLRKLSGLFLFALVSQPVFSVELKWNIEQTVKHKYSAVAEVNVTDRLNDPDFSKLSISSSSFINAIEELKKFTVIEGEQNYVADFRKLEKKQGLRVRMYGVDFLFEGKARDAYEKELRDRADIFKNAIMLQGDFNLSGDSAEYTFYRSQKERNVLTQFFYLPKKPVKIGDTWELPVKYLTLGPGFFVEKEDYVNKVTLKNLTKSKSGTVAEIHYLIINKVEGYAERILNSPKGRLPLTLVVSSFGYGLFHVEKGRWIRQSFVLSYQGTGKAMMNKRLLFSLDTVN